MYFLSGVDNRALRITQTYCPPSEERTEPARDPGGSKEDADGRTDESHLL